MSATPSGPAPRPPLSTPVRLDAVGVRLAGRRIVQEVTLAADGDVVGLVGPNGSGKSTVLRTLYRVLRPAAGTVSVDGRDVWDQPAREAARTTAAVVQDGPADVDLSVAEYVTTGRIPHGRLLSAPGRGDREAVDAALDAAGAAALASRHVATLSGGERQRVHLARALAQQPAVLVLDEPTNHLDVAHQLQLLTLVRSLGVTTLVTLHDLNLAAAYCDRVVVLDGGRVVASGEPADVLTPELLLDVFGVLAAPLVNPLTGRLLLAYHQGDAPDR